MATPDRHRVVIARQAGGRGGPAWPSVTTPTCTVVCAILSCGYSRQTQSSYSQAGGRGGPALPSVTTPTCGADVAVRIAS